MREMRGDVRDLFHAFRIALDPGKMILGLAGLLFTAAGLAVIGWLGARVGLTGAEYDYFSTALSNGELGQAAHDVWVGSQRALSGVVPDPLTGKLPAAAVVADARWWHCLFPGRYAGGTNWIGLGLLTAAVLWLAFVWSFIGGALARICAVEVAKDERLSVNEGFHFATHHFGGFFWSPLGVVACIVVLVLGNAAVGLVGAIPYLGDVLAVIFAPLTLIASLVILCLAVGGGVGQPLMAPALAAEGTDAFDAVSRSMSYVFGRPFRLIGYAIVSKVYGLLSCAVVWAFAFGVVKVMFFTVGLGMHAFTTHRKLDLIGDYIFGRSQSEAAAVTMGEIAAEHGWFSPVLLIVLAVLVLLVYGLAAGYMVSFQYTARTLIYFVLRRVEDHTDMDEVWLEEESDGEPDAVPAPAPAAGDGTAADPNAAATPGIDAAQQQAAQEAREAGGDTPTVGETPEA